MCWLTRCSRLGREAARKDAATWALDNECLKKRAQDAEARVAALEGALEKIANWKDFPATGKTWPSGNPISYGAENGFVGERDYMRGVAMQAIAAGGGNG